MGVTGSGKTEVYLHLIAEVLARGRQALVLVPEINLTPQLEALLRARFPAHAHRLHCTAVLTRASAYAAGSPRRRGEAGIVLGTRLAVFTPLAALGLIVVDEEHDASFKQMDGLRYSARDLALVRAKRRAIPIVLGSATPRSGNFSQCGDRRLPGLGAEPAGQRDAGGDRVCRHAQCAAHRWFIAGIVESDRCDRQARRAESRLHQPARLCASIDLPQLQLDRELPALLGQTRDARDEPAPALPPLRSPGSDSRGVPGLRQSGSLAVGAGTQRIESALARTFPAARILRVDRDSTRRKHAWEDMRRQIRAQEVDILVGTQILAKGPRFSATESGWRDQCGQLVIQHGFSRERAPVSRLTQVAGRAGRGATRGRVLIQTEFPQHPLYQALRRHDYPAYARELLAERKQAGFPPFVHQAVLRAEAPQLPVALDFLAHAARAGTQIAAPVNIYDPVPASLVRLAGLERAQLTVQARSRAALQRFLHAWHARLTALGERKVRWALDVDPLEL